MLLCEDSIKFEPIRRILETSVKLPPFCILTCSLRLVFSFLSGQLLKRKMNDFILNLHLYLHIHELSR